MDYESKDEEYDCDFSAIQLEHEKVVKELKSQLGFYKQQNSELIKEHAFLKTEKGKNCDLEKRLLDVKIKDNELVAFLVQYNTPGTDLKELKWPKIILQLMESHADLRKRKYEWLEEKKNFQDIINQLENQIMSLKSSINQLKLKNNNDAAENVTNANWTKYLEKSYNEENSRLKRENEAFLIDKKELSEALTKLKDEMAVVKKDCDNYRNLISTLNTETEQNFEENNILASENTELLKNLAVQAKELDKVKQEYQDFRNSTEKELLLLKTTNTALLTSNNQLLENMAQVQDECDCFRVSKEQLKEEIKRVHGQVSYHIADRVALEEKVTKLEEQLAKSQKEVNESRDIATKAATGVQEAQVENEDLQKRNEELLENVVILKLESESYRVKDAKINNTMQSLKNENISIAAEKAQMHEKLIILEMQLARTQHECENLFCRLTAKQLEMEELKSEKSKLVKYKKEYENSNRRITKLNDEILRLETLYQRANRVVEDKEEQLHSIQKDFEDYCRNVSHIEEKIIASRKENARHIIFEDELKSIIIELRQKLEDKNQESSKQHSIIAALQNQLPKLQQELQKCKGNLKRLNNQAPNSILITADAAEIPTTATDTKNEIKLPKEKSTANKRRGRPPRKEATLNQAKDENEVASENKEPVVTVKKRRRRRKRVNDVTVRRVPKRSRKKRPAPVDIPNNVGGQPEVTSAPQSKKRKRIV